MSQRAILACLGERMRVLRATADRVVKTVGCGLAVVFLGPFVSAAFLQKLIVDVLDARLFVSKCEQLGVFGWTVGTSCCGCFVSFIYAAVLLLHLGPLFLQF